MIDNKISGIILFSFFKKINIASYFRNSSRTMRIVGVEMIETFHSIIKFNSEVVFGENMW